MNQSVLQFFAPKIDYWMIKPELVVLILGFMVLLLDLVIPKDKKRYLGYITLAGLAYCFYCITRLPHGAEHQTLMQLFKLDPLAIFIKYLFIFAAFVTVLLSITYIRRERVERGEFYELILFATSGMMFMTSTENFVMIYLGLELMALCVYILAGFLVYDEKSTEGALKYFILGTFSSAIFLLGVSFLYGMTNSLNIYTIAGNMAALYESQPMLFSLSMILVVVGFGFKIAMVPFHFWCPDVYEGAPTPITAFMSIAPKAAGIAVILRVFTSTFCSITNDWLPLFYFAAILSMTLGNVVAIWQQNIKRMLAYSSIAHVGFMLIGLVASSNISGDGLPDGLSAILYYLFAYAFANLGAFAIVIYLGREGKVGDKIEDYNGLAYKSPYAAAVMTIFLLSLAGIPPTAGFVAKFYIFGAAIREHFYVLAVIGILNAVISLYYYMKVTMNMYMRESRLTLDLNRSGALHAGIVLMVILTLYYGIFPRCILDFARRAIEILVA